MPEQPMGLWLCRSWRKSLLVMYVGKDNVRHQTGNCDNAPSEDYSCLAARREGEQEDEG